MGSTRRFRQLGQDLLEYFDREESLLRQGQTHIISSDVIESTFELLMCNNVKQRRFFYVEKILIVIKSTTWGTLFSQSSDSLILLIITLYQPEAKIAMSWAKSCRKKGKNYIKSTSKEPSLFYPKWILWGFVWELDKFSLPLHPNL